MTDTFLRDERIRKAAEHITCDAGERPLVERCLEIIHDTGAVDHYVTTVENHIELAGKTLLDVGSSACWHAPYYLAAGNSSVQCVDKYIDLSTRSIRNNHAHQEGRYALDELPMTLEDFLGSFDRIAVSMQDIADFSDSDRCFDVAVLLTVSEHLMEPTRAFDAISKCIAPGGEILITHGNFYAWAGHHLAPYTPDEYDPYDPAHSQLADWSHVVNKARFDRRFADLNLIRIHELAAILGRHFDATRIEFQHSPETVTSRLTPRIRASLAEYYEDELLTELYVYHGRKRISKPDSTSVSDSPIAIRVKPSTYREENCYLLPIPFGTDPDRFRLFEDGFEIGKPNSQHEEIRKIGDGRYSIWGHTLYFSTPGNSDPVHNGHVYELRRIFSQQA